MSSHYLSLIAVTITVTVTVTVDPDLAYRPRVNYSHAMVTAAGRWYTSSGECVNTVLRGCFNNGTCVGPDICECATGE